MFATARPAVILATLAAGCSSPRPPDSPDPASPPPPSVELSVEVKGRGQVRVGPLWSCGTRCALKLVLGMRVTLIPEAEEGFAFLGWRGACEGRGPCRLTPTAEPASLTARFEGPRYDLAWLRRIGGEGSESSSGMAVESQGDLVVAGSFNSATVDLGGVTLQRTGREDAFVAKYRGADGALLWAQRIGGAGHVEVDVDGEGDVYAAASVPGIARLAGTSYPSAARTDGLLVKLEGKTGRIAWVRQRRSRTSVRQVRVATDGSILFASVYSLVKLDAGGTVLWQKSLSPEAVEGLTIDSQGNVYFAPRLVDLKNKRSHAGLEKLRGSDGARLWRKTLHSGGSAHAARRATWSEDGSLVIGGEFRRDLSLGAETIQGMGGYDLFVARLDAADGSARTLFALGGPGRDWLNSVSTLKGNNIVCGGFEQSLTIGGMKLWAGRGERRTLVAELSSSGQHVWSEVYENGGRCWVEPVAGKDLLIVGNFGGPMTFAGRKATARGYRDIFLARLERCPVTGCAE